MTNAGCLRTISETGIRERLSHRSYGEMTISAFTESNLRPATAKDVARLAGVSVATVSRVVNGAGNVSS